MPFQREKKIKKAGPPPPPPTYDCPDNYPNLVPLLVFISATLEIIFERRKKLVDGSGLKFGSNAFKIQWRHIYAQISTR